jgi:hypothetical protein
MAILVLPIWQPGMMALGLHLLVGGGQIDKATADDGIGPTAVPITADQAAAAVTAAGRFIDTITQVLPRGLTPPHGPAEPS